ncbi:hypothetical protein [Nocardioides sp. AN3]
MSKTVPTKPPRRPFQPAYEVTTTTRVPGRVGAPEPVETTPTDRPTEPSTARV